MHECVLIYIKYIASYSLFILNTRNVHLVRDRQQNSSADDGKRIGEVTESSRTSGKDSDHKYGQPESDSNTCDDDVQPLVSAVPKAIADIKHDTPGYKCHSDSSPREILVLSTSSTYVCSEAYIF